MRSAYKYLAHTIAGLVAIQAASVAFAMFGLLHWVGEDNNTLTPSAVNDRSAEFNGSLGFAIHSFGSLAISLLAIALLIIAFFAKLPGGVRWAGFVFLAVLLQWVFAIVAFSAPVAGLLHGLNALVLFSVALQAAKRVSTTAEVATPAEVAANR